MTNVWLRSTVSLWSDRAIESMPTCGEEEWQCHQQSLHLVGVPKAQLQLPPREDDPSSSFLRHSES